MPLHAPLALASLISLRAIYHKILGGPSPKENRWMIFIRWAGILIGTVIITFLIKEVGWKNIEKSLSMMKWGYGIVLLYPMSWFLLNTAGWRMALHRQYARIPLIKLSLIRLSGEAFNSLLPSGYLGGEPLKVKLLARWIPGQEATSSVLIAKAAQSVALVFFAGIGLTLATGQGHTRIAHNPKSLIALAALSVGIFIFTVLLTSRSFSRFGRWLHNLTGHPWLQKQDAKLIALDDSIGAFYREGKGRFLGSILWHLAGWIAGALEVAVIFYLIGHAISWRQAWFIGAVAQLAAIIGLFAPAGIGLYEGGHYLAAGALGLSPALGVSVALIRRVREICWVSLGLFIFWRISKDQASTGFLAPGNSTDTSLKP